MENRIETTIEGLGPRACGSGLPAQSSRFLDCQHSKWTSKVGLFVAFSSNLHTEEALKQLAVWASMFVWGSNVQPRTQIVGF